MRASFIRTAVAIGIAVVSAWLIGGAPVQVGAQRSQASGGSPQPRGKAVYDAHCVQCHGTSGRGDGPAAAFVNPRPRNFSSGGYKIRTTETDSVPTDDDLIRSVRQGLFGT